MECLVCHASRTAGSTCPQCGWDAAAPGARDQRAVLAARQAFRDRTTAYPPQTRVTRRDRLVPWLGLGLGLLLLMFWLASCRAFS